jgi:hypothetical protein
MGLQNRPRHDARAAAPYAGFDDIARNFGLDDIFEQRPQIAHALGANHRKGVGRPIEAALAKACVVSLVAEGGERRILEQRSGQRRFHQVERECFRTDSATLEKPRNFRCHPLDRGRRDLIGQRS